MDERRKNDNSKPRNKKPTILDHSLRVAYYSVCIAKELGLDARKIRTISLAAKLHDIGKICVLDEILLKPNTLDPAEKAMIRRHPEYGAQLLVDMDYAYDDFSFSIESHHENFDGTGYPNGIAGYDIPIAARIISIADTFDALTTVRGYNTPSDLEDALVEIQLKEDTQFDPDLVRVFIRYVMNNVDEINQIIESANQNKPLDEQFELKADSLKMGY